MLIRCPYCGPREVSEFGYGGDATVRRPEPDAPPKAWHEYVYRRRNPKGLHVEHWQHVGGCRLWLTIERDTASNGVVASSIAGPWRGHADREND